MKANNDTNMKRRRTQSSERGVTLTELVVVVVIVATMASLAVPVAVTRSRQAKVKKALADVRMLADAEEMVAATHGYYVPLQVLDDLPDDASFRDRLNRDLDTGLLDEEVDMITREPANLRFTNALIPLNNSLSVLQILNPINLSQAENNQPGLFGDKRAVDVFLNWQGPFVNFERFFILDESLLSRSTMLDFPLDPWGNPYFLYSPLGIVGSGAAEFQASIDERPTANDYFAVDPNPVTGADPERQFLFSDGRLEPEIGSTTLQEQDIIRRFDRWAVVSFGPDGVAGGLRPRIPPTNGLGDDIVIFFGTRFTGDPVETEF